MSNEPGKPAGISPGISGRPVSDIPRFDLVSVGGDSCALDAEGHCITCSDEAQPARVIQIDQELGTALVEMKDETGEVDITLVDEVVPGNWLLVHGGVAIATIESEDAIHRAPITGAKDE